MGKAEFENLLRQPGPHLVLFAVKWCGYCSIFLEQIRSLNSGSDVEIDLVDADNPDESLWDDFSIVKVPTLIVFKDGQVVFRKDGRSPLSLSGGGLNMSDVAEALSVLS